MQSQSNLTQLKISKITNPKDTHLFQASNNNSQQFEAARNSSPTSDPVSEESRDKKSTPTSQVAQPEMEHATDNVNNQSLNRSELDNSIFLQPDNNSPSKLSTLPQQRFKESAANENLKGLQPSNKDQIV
jgi:hypothetical protein